jgi:hypothetical protein
MSHPLEQVFQLAIKQVTEGKGERHGGNAIPFMEQPWSHYAKMHGRGFLTGQAAKKLEEAASTREGEAFVQEALGAIVYIAMAVLNEPKPVVPPKLVVPPELQFEPTAIRQSRCPHKDVAGKRCTGKVGHRGRHSSKER